MMMYFRMQLPSHSTGPLAPPDSQARTHPRPSSVSARSVLPHGRAPRADLRAACGAELGQDVGYVGRDRLGREHELFGDLRVGEARRYEPGDLELTLAQPM